MKLTIPLIAHVLIILISHVHSQKTTLVRNSGNYTVAGASEITYIDYLTFLARSKQFIDKTYFIYALMTEYKKHNVMLFVYPPRWGKTVILKMLRAFLEVSVSRDGFREPFNETNNYKLFVHGRIDRHHSRVIDFDKPLIISQQMEFVREHHGQYPVIYADFNTVGGSNHSEFVSSLKTLFRGVFKEHTYVLKRYAAVNRTSSADLQTYEDIMLGKEENEDVLKNALFHLSKLLNLFFNEPVILLIDNYDIPLNNTVCNEKYLFRESSENLYRDLLRMTLKMNPFIGKAVVMGKLKLHQLNLPADFDFIEQYTITQYNFIEYFGFNQLEVDAYYDSTSVGNNTLNEKGRLNGRKWYNGYQIGASSEMRIYNPWSAVNYAIHKTLSIWWAREQKINYLLKKAMKIWFFENAMSILLSRSIYFIHLLGFTYGLKDFQELYNNKDDQHLTTNIALEYLLSMGYMSINGTYTGEAHLSKTPIQVPNEEVRKSLVFKVLTHFKKRLRIPKRIDYPTHFNFAIQQLNICSTIENSTCDRFRLGMERFLGELPTFVSQPRRFNMSRNTNTMFMDDLMVRTLFNFMFIFTDIFRFLGYNELLTETADGQGVAFIIKYNNSLNTEELHRAQEYYRSCFQRLKRIKKMKTIEITITKDKKVNISNTLF